MLTRTPSEFARRQTLLRALGFVLGQRAALPVAVKGLLVWYYGTAWPGKSPLQVPTAEIVRFATQYLGYRLTPEGGITR